jgi:serine/threonine/tyrosine-interacting protein
MALLHSRRHPSFPLPLPLLSPAVIGSEQALICREIRPDDRYEMRREAQVIIPGLWLGPFQASTNLHLMNSLRITHVCVRTGG